MNTPAAARKLAILHTEASRGWGGQEIRILTEAAGMIARGHRVLLACPGDARIFREATRFQVPAVELPLGRKRLGAVFDLRRWLARQEFDVINSHSSTDTWLVALARLMLRRAPPLVRTRHISAAVPRNLASNWLYRHATSRVVTTGEALRAQLIRDNGLDPHRVISVPTGIDPGHFQTGDRLLARKLLDLPADAELIGIVATLRSWKGHRFLFDALKRMNRPNARLVVVGDGPQRSPLFRLAADLDILDRVVFAGNQNDVAPWLRALDVFSLPSYANEGVPQALLQAMMTGLPCVTTAAGAIGEIAQNELTALVVPMQDAGGLAKALARLLDDEPLRHRLGETARQTVLARHSLEAMLDRMEIVFSLAARA
ncbi:N-acetyl-alpha-D-glucosaminyl L-malate synthase [Burkholderiales bacterium]|nr:N-acetyl-alpha-D-glucosaminyl L-malate synthase [Burkholderiales bacterium]